MKTISVFLASSDELKEERMLIADLFNELNDIFLPRGIYLQLVKWEKLDSSMGPLHKQKEYNEKLKTCEMCIVMYWTKLGDYTGQELTTAYNGLKEGRNPQKLYVFFKEPGGITPELQSFKLNFESEYGHFYCKFENADSMRLHFLLQLEAYQNKQMKELIKVEDSKIKFGDLEVADFVNIPFAFKNKEYIRLKDNILNIETEIKDIESILASVPNESLENLLSKKRSELFYAKKELSKHEGLLFDTALRITELQGDIISERMARAIKAFEAGNASEANTIMDEAIHDARSLMNDLRKTKELLRSQQHCAEISISELLLKASFILSDETESINSRITSAHEIYKEAYDLSKESDYDRYKYMDMLYKYGEFLYTYGKYEDCLNIRLELLNTEISILGSEHSSIACSYNAIGATYESISDYKKALEYFTRSLSISLNGEDKLAVAIGFNNIGTAFNYLGDFNKALEFFETSLKIRASIFSEDHITIATCYNNLGAVNLSLDNPHKALEYFDKALEIKLSHLQEKHHDIAIAYCNLGFAHSSLGDNNKALVSYQTAHNILTSIFGENHLDVATNYNNIALTNSKLGNYHKALELHTKSLDIRISILGENNGVVASSYHNIGATYYKLKDYHNALKYLEKSHRIYCTILGKDHTTTKSVLENINGIKKLLPN